MQIDHPKEKCQRPNCDCEVEAGHPYCSEHCRAAAEFSGVTDEASTVGESCNCGHAGCADSK